MIPICICHLVEDRECAGLRLNLCWHIGPLRDEDRGGVIVTWGLLATRITRSMQRKARSCNRFISDVNEVQSPHRARASIVCFDAPFVHKKSVNGGAKYKLQFD